MIGKRNLGKAVVLGLLLSTGVYGAAWAEDIEMGGKLWNEAWNPNYTEIEAGDNLVVTTGGVGIGPNGTVNVIDGDLTVESGSNSIQSGYSENATVQILANNVTLNSGDNGILTTGTTLGSDNKYPSTVLVGSEDNEVQSLTINADGNGIDNQAGNIYIYGSDNSEINISTNGTSYQSKDKRAAIHNGYSKGEIIVNGGTINLSTTTGHGISTWNGTTTLNSNQIDITTVGKDDSNGIDVMGGTTTLNSDTITITTEDGDGINSTGSATTSLNSNNVSITAGGSYGIYNTSGTVSLNTKGNNTINVDSHGVYSARQDGQINIIASENANPDGWSDKSTLGESAYRNDILTVGTGIFSSGSATINVMADHTNRIMGSSSGIYSRGQKSIINIRAGQDNSIGNAYFEGEVYDGDIGIELSSKGSGNVVNVISEKGQTDIYGKIGISSTGSGNNGQVFVDAGTNINIDSKDIGVKVSGENNSTGLTADGVNAVSVNGGTGTNKAGLSSSNKSTITLDAQGNAVSLIDNGAGNGIESTKEGNVSLKGAEYNTILANSTELSTLADTDGSGDTYGDKYAINASDGGTVDMKAGSFNTVYGAVYATGDEKNGVGSVTIGKLDAEGSTFSRAAGGDVVNYIGSAAVIDKAGDLDQSKDETMRNLDVVSALYAQGGAEIHLSGNNTIRTYANKEDDTTAERSIWAYDKGKINVDGYTDIRTNQYDKSPNSMDVAVAAGTATNLDADDFTNYPVDDDSLAKVTINYANANGVKSYIEGDVLAAYGGVVTIQAQEGVTRAVNTSGIDIHGNLLSGNKGVLNVSLGNGGTLTGRADDYGDAGTVANSGHGTANGEGETFFNPAFSSEILTGGEVNLTMGEGSKWTVTGQSWITKVDTGHSEHVEIDLSATDSELNKTVQALTIGEMKGNAMFTMQLDGERSVSDMLYMKKAEGEYFINLKNAVTVEDMYQDGFDGLRFATVGKESHATFSAGTYGNGVYNIEYEVGTDNYDGNEENSAYNSTSGKGEMDEAKPGNDLVDNLFKDEPQEAAANGIMTLAAVASPESTDASDTTEDMGKNTDMNGKELNVETNFKLIDVKSTELSNAGKTIIDMSKVNYSNAIYMDRLNKRMGEARYIDGDEGLWVRIRHDRIGKSDAFRSKNTMMELGYDKRVDDREDGEHRRGFAIDYMRGTTDYHNVAGDGDVRRGGVWFYDTWLGNKGHYSDYVLKFGRLSNDFDIYSELGEKITGDYSNFVYSASAEYGRKKDIGKDWYFEPQVQLQYAHVTDADYTTSQGTSVELDAIDSLIGRVGFRLGKDMGENNTFYVKADVLHEFLGDQDISAFDATGRLDTTYENEGTWYDVGLGFSHQFSKGTYMFLDVEKTFGNDNEDTYQFNVGMNWKV
ncbi:autotransporter outer membrane beta-barrel domain-containing protein [Megasphaera sp. SW808]|nr:autotransporter outer membrane beta-barrel domain-containing protein [Megasphaera sp. SW808]